MLDNNNNNIENVNDNIGEETPEISSDNVSSEDNDVLNDIDVPSEDTEVPCPPNPEKKQSWIASVLDYTEIFVFAISLVVLIFSFFFRICTVEGPSMEKTLLNGETLLVSNVGYNPEREDIIVFHQTGTLNEAVVKRVIATGGETVDIDFNTWTVTITDKEGNTFVLEEPYMHLDNSYKLTAEIKFPYYVPEGQLFVMGDNRNHSADSRGTRIGLVDERRVLGKVLLRISPLDKFGAVK